MVDENSCAVLYSDYDQAEEAARVLIKAGFGSDKVFIVDKSYSSEGYLLGLLSLGLPGSSIICYERAIKSGQSLLVVHGTTQGIERVCELLATGDPTDVAIHL